MNSFHEWSKDFLNTNDLIIEKLEKIKKELNDKLNDENEDGINEGVSMIDDLIFHIKVRI